MIILRLGMSAKGLLTCVLEYAPDAVVENRCARETINVDILDNSEPCAKKETTDLYKIGM